MPPTLRRTLPPVPIVLALALAACGPAMREHSRPLIDGEHQPDVLTESQILYFPATQEPNRFLTGWWPSLRGQSLHLTPTAGPGRIELVNLRSRPRQLRLQAYLGEVDQGVLAQASFPDGSTATMPLRRSMSVDLPPMPLGRSTVDFEFPVGIRVFLQQGRVAKALPAGEVSFAGDGSILQEPDSAIDFAQAIPAGAVLRGGFVPPREADPGLRFQLLVETEHQPPAVVFEWPGEGPMEIEVPLSSAEHLARIRLLATGRGGAGRWRDLRLTWNEPEPEVTAPPTAPKIVMLYVFDALRADTPGYAGTHPGLTPVLDRLAAEGVVLERHISVAPNTKPSLKSLFTGRAAIQDGNRRLPEDGPPTIAQVFAEGGFHSAAFAGTPWISRGFGTHRGFAYRATEAQYRSEPPNDNAKDVHRSALAWLDGLKPDDRAFMYLHTMHPHNPYNPPEPFKSRFAAGIDSEMSGATRTLLGIKRESVAASSEDRRRVEALYQAGMAYNDDQLGAFIEDVASRYEPGEVLVVFTSDHGEELWDHDGVLHGYTLYEEQLRVPLLFWWPGRLDAGRIAAATDHLDLHATLRELVTAEAGDIDGTSIWPLLTGQREEHKPVRFAAAASLQGGIFMASSDRYKLIYAPRAHGKWGMGQGAGRTRDQEYVFDLQNDPGETRNLAGDRILEVDWLRSRLLAWIESGRLRDTSPGELEEIDEETRRKLEALGYLD